MSKRANPARGEVAILVGGETVVLRPSFEALVAAEDELGPLFALVERAAEGKLTLAETAALFWHCAGGAAVPVRFAEDRLEVNRATFLAGDAPNVPLIEARES